MAVADQALCPSQFGQSPSVGLLAASLPGPPLLLLPAWSVSSIAAAAPAIATDPVTCFLFLVIPYYQAPSPLTGKARLASDVALMCAASPHQRATASAGN